MFSAMRDDDDIPTNSTKNSTRLASVLGSWVMEGSMKADAAGLSMKAYVTVHFVCDSQLKGNYCALDWCPEIENNVCVFNSTGPRCKTLADTVMDWSDVVAFLYFGIDADCDPIHTHEHQSTGGWVGPYSVIMAQNQTTYVKEDGRKVVDSYTVKFVNSPTTPYLKYLPDCNLFAEDDFYNYLGAGAVNTTVHSYMSGSDDPYAKYYKTCDNGSIMPVLPAFQLDFLQDPKDAEDKETLVVTMNYHILTFPKKGDPMYDLMPRFKKEGFPVSGPYCYKGDPNRGWTIDMEYNSEEGGDFVALEHACIEGIPCLPPSVENCHCTSSAHGASPDFVPENEGTEINLQIVITLSIILGITGLLLLISIYTNWRQWKKNRQLEEKITEEEIVEEEDLRESSYYLEMEKNRDGAGDHKDDGDDKVDKDHDDSGEPSDPQLEPLLPDPEQRQFSI